MSVQVRRRREASAFLSSYVGAQGELIVDTTNNRVQVHDGATPGGWPAARLADVAARTNVADAAYTVLVSDRTVAFTALAAARSVTLPAASAFPTGTQLLVVDESGGCSATNTITLIRAGSDTINGATSAVLALPWGYLALVSNGASRWTIVDQSTASLAQQSAGNVAITGGTITGTTGGFTSLATSGAVTIGGPTTINSTLNLAGALTSASAVNLSGSNTFTNANFVNTGGAPKATNSGSGSTTFAGSWEVWTSDNTRRGYFGYGDGGTNIVVAGDGGYGVKITGAAATIVPPLTLSATLKLAAYTVATLPAGTAGTMVFASNGRKTSEAAGAGTGVTAVYSNGAWRRLSDETAVAA